MKKDDLQKILPACIEAVKKAGHYIKTQRISLSDVDEKEKNSLVSYVDRQAEEILADALNKILPDAGFLTEEKTVTQSTQTNLRWIIDPLDGTTNFVYGIPFFCVSIALEAAGKILLGIIYEPVRDECFYSYDGSHAYLNGKEISVRSSGKWHESVIVTGFPYNLHGIEEQYFSVFKEVTLQTRAMRRLGSAALDLAYVASGRMHAFYEARLNAWDIAAGGLIVKNAGGVVCDFSGNDHWLVGNIVAGNEQVVHALIEILKKNGF